MTISHRAVRLPQALRQTTFRRLEFQVVAFSPVKFEQNVEMIDELVGHTRISALWLNTQRRKSAKKIFNMRLFTDASPPLVSRPSPQQ